jgi:hypothetical protein
MWYLQLAGLVYFENFLIGSEPGKNKIISLYFTLLFGKIFKDP